MAAFLNFAENSVLTPICALYQTFSYAVVNSENFHIGGIF